MVGVKSASIEWHAIVDCIEENFGVCELFQWVQIDMDRAFFICPDVRDAEALVNWNSKDCILGDPEFCRWSSDLLAIRYDSLFKKRWIKVWGLPLHLWTMEIFSAIGRICGELSSVDPVTSTCKELRWIRLELLEGDLRNILQQLAVMDNGKYFQVLITIEGEIAVDDSRVNDGARLKLGVIGSESYVLPEPSSLLGGKGFLNFELKSKFSSLSQKSGKDMGVSCS